MSRRKSIIASSHAVVRYRDRVRPALTRKLAKAELERLAREHSTPLDELPKWMTDRRERADYYMQLADGIVAACNETSRTITIVTILTRAGNSPETRAAKNEYAARQRARRRAKRRRQKSDRRIIQ